MAGHSSSVAQNGNIVQAVHAGANFAFVNFKSGGTNTPFSRSVSDTINVFNLPRGAQIIAAWLGGATVDGNAGFTLGDPGSATRYGGPFTISATTRQAIPMDAPVGFVYSVSDDQNSYPLTLTLLNTTSASGSLSIHVGLLWKKV
jgi:hypothetical protein